MKQPELGKKICELRNSKGITQKELSDACNIDIRTIQRIESGEVVPRMSTLKLIATTLDCDLSVFNGNTQNTGNTNLNRILIFSFSIGIIYLINFILLTAIIPGVTDRLHNKLYLLLSVIHVFAGVLFYSGFYVLSKHQQNMVLQVALIISIVFIPVFVITDQIAKVAMHDFVIYLNKWSVIVIGINGFLFGTGLLIAKSKYSVLYKFAGILQLIISPMFIIPIPIVQMVGLWLAIPFILMLLTIVFCEYTETRPNRIYAET